MECDGGEITSFQEMVNEPQTGTRHPSCANWRRVHEFTRSAVLQAEDVPQAAIGRDPLCLGPSQYCRGAHKN